MTRAGIDPEFRQTGVLKLAFSEEQATELHDEVEWQQALGIGVEWLDADDVLHRERGVTMTCWAGLIRPWRATSGDSGWWMPWSKRPPGWGPIAGIRSKSPG